MNEVFGSLWLFEESFGSSPPDGLKERTTRDSRMASPKILVVDDEQIIADTICEILASAGFEVAVAYDGWEAVEKAAKFKPDQLLSDVKMPHMNGVELAMAIRRMYPSTKILLFSAQVGVFNLLLDAEKQGFHFQVLAKPIHPSDLIERLKRNEKG